MNNIPMNAPMALATQQRIKTHTRRIVKVGDKYIHNPTKKEYFNFTKLLGGAIGHSVVVNPPYKTGQVLWVREPAKVIDSNIYNGSITFEYQTDGKQITLKNEIDRFIGNFSSSPKNWYFTKDWIIRKQGIPNGCIREMARTFIRVTNIRVERLNEIREEDAKSEGVDYITFFNVEDGIDKPLYRNYKYPPKKWTIYNLFTSAKESFVSLWESINGKGSFDNRWVWVVEFELISKEEAKF